MKQLYDSVSYQTAKIITKKYSTSFSLAVKFLDKSIRQDVYNIYGFVRIADEIVDSFTTYNKEVLLNRFEEDLWFSITEKISVNPVLNAFQETVHKYAISKDLIRSFMQSMRADLTKKAYVNKQEIDAYIYGSADVVGLMCLKVFVKGNQKQYDNLKNYAIKLGSAFQKVNFLRDLKQDAEELNRAYFPNVDVNNLTEQAKEALILDIKKDFYIARKGVYKLPKEAKFGVYLAYIYYLNLLKKIEKTPANILKEERIRVSNPVKVYYLIKSYVKFN
jgi:phytoene/squalene synthetase